SAQVAFRVNPDVAAQTHPYISTGLREHKFGVPIEDAGRLYKKAASEKYLRVAGVSLHIGSQITDVSPFGMAAQRAVELVRQLTSDGHNIRFLDAGGGLGISYESSASAKFSDYVAEYAHAIIRPLQQLGKLRPHLLLEPGRSVIAPTGALLTRVLYSKSNGNKSFSIVDAAMNDLIRPSLYGAKHEIVPVMCNPSSVERTFDVVGPVCETGDFLARDASLPPLTAGGNFCVFFAWAYGLVVAFTFNNRSLGAA